jgi:hypothetical protein
MSTVASRKIRSTPFRDAAETWEVIVFLLTRGTNKKAEVELLRVIGVAASVITDLTLKDAPIIVTCDGPRTRIYCIYNDDAMDDSNAQEEALGFDPLNGEWSLSFPCETDDLSWVKSALAKQSTRISARDRYEGVLKGATKSIDAINLTVDPKRFLDL